MTQSKFADPIESFVTFNVLLGNLKCIAGSINLDGGPMAFALELALELRRGVVVCVSRICAWPGLFVAMI